MEGTIIDIENIMAKDIRVEVDETKGVEVEVEDTNENMDEDASAWTSITAPDGPVFSILSNNKSLPPTSDVSVDSEFVEEVDDDTQEWSTLKRKCCDKPGAELKPRWKVARRENAGRVLDNGSEVETNDDSKQCQSVIVSRKLKESVKSGDFVADKKKRKRFEEKCTEMESGVKFHYGGASWQVLHSKCLRWYKMSELYNTTKFKQHLGACKAKGNECNTLIMSFFKPKDINTEAKTKITASGQEQIFVGNNTCTPMPIKPPHTNNKLLARTLPCCGISDIHNSLMSTYISWTVVEGAGSIWRL